jgi:hypothetical protein
MGLINGGGFQYYGGPGPLAAGVDAFSDRFIKALLAMKESGRQDRDSQARQALQAEQLVAMQREAQKEAALQDEIMNLRGAVNMPGLLQSGIVNPQTPVTAIPDFGQTQAAVGSSDPVAMRQVAMGQTPQGMPLGMLNDPTVAQYADALAKYEPAKGIALKEQMAEKDAAAKSEFVKSLITAAQNGSLGAQGKALLKQLGYEGVFTENPKDRKYGVEETYDPATHTTMGRDFYWGKDGEKVYVGKQRPIKGRESTRIVMPGDDRRFGTQLRKEFNALPEVKEANETMPKITSMEKAYAESLKTNNFVAVDQALITLYNKLTDPTSVVRESEYARTAMNIPTLNMIKGKAQKVLTGGAGLTVAERNALIRMARLMSDGYKEIKSNRLNEYRGYAEGYGLDPDDHLRLDDSNIKAPKTTAKYADVVSKYFPPDEVDKALQVMHKESSGRPGATNTNKNGTKDGGLFQINDVNIPDLIKAGFIRGRKDLYDPETNIAAAAYLYKRYGWKPWAATAGSPSRTFKTNRFTVEVE